MNRKVLFIFLLIISILIILPADLSAQCQMCKSNIEMARRDGGTSVGNTLNNGILYLLALPYSIAMVFGIIYYRKYRQNKKLQLSQSDSN